MKRIDDAYELSPLQEGMLSHGLDAGSSGVDVEQVVGCFEERLDEAALREAWDRVTARHAILRTAFRWQGPAAPRQEVSAQVELPWQRLDGRGRGLPAHLAADRQRGFDLSQAPLMRFAIAAQGESRWTLLWTFHHALLDGRSFPLVLEEVFTAYDAIRRGEAWDPPRPRPYRDYIVWLRDQDLSAAEAWWRAALAGFRAPTPLGVGRERPGAAGMGACERRLSELGTAALREFARAHGLTLNTLLQGAWALLLHRYSGEEDLVFGATRACRRSALGGADDLVGLLINTLPLRVRVVRADPLVPWLRRLREQQVALRPYEHAPLVKVQTWSDVPRGRPLFESLVVFENQTLEQRLRSLGGPWERRRFLYRGQTNYPVTVIGYGDPELLVRVEYDRSRFTDGAGQRLLGHLVTLLEAMAAAPADAPLAALPILTLKEHRILAAPVVARSPTSGPCLHERFEAQVARTPEAVAVSCEGASLSYAELDRRANGLAHRLRDLGVGPETLVGLSLERSLDLVVAILGILKAGGAYLPLDPAYPRERLAFMVEDSRVPVIVTERSLLASLPPGQATRVLMDELGPGAEQGPASGVTAGNLAYVIYTSGSTGKPKGCEVTHGNVTRLFESTAAWFGFGAHDVWTLFHSYAFDFTVWELWGALLHGGRLVVVPYWVSRSPEAFLELLGRERVSVLSQTPSAFRQLVQADLTAGGDPDSLALRYVVFGGEALDPQSLRPWYARHGDRRPQLVNMYGITETTVHVTYRPLGEADVEAGTGSVIGVPIPDLYVRLLDPHGQPVPIGVPGEIYVGGAGVARGYLNRPELTAQRFVRDPFSEDPKGRLYRSGDLARWREDGELEYLGRIDGQVKIRGFRVELGEIEAVLAQHGAVRGVAVLAREDSPGNRLVAYVDAEGDRGALADELRAQLRAALPDYMVPSAFVFLDALPLTENGKVDRKALPPPDPSRPEGRSYVAPRNAGEQTLVSVWASVLGVERVGIHDNFFELGGDSILAIQVIARARAAFLHLTPRDLFKRPTIAELVAGLPAEAAGPAVAAEAPAQGTVPLTPVQHWFFELGLPEPHHWNQAFVFVAPPDVDAERLEQALQTVVRHHDAFRLRFRRTGSGWEQFYAPAADPLLLQRIDLPSTQALETAAGSVQAGLDLEEGPLARAALISLGPGKGSRLLLVLHHLIVDAVSWRILLEDLERSYEGMALPPPTSSYQRWARRLAEHAGTGAFRSSLPHWLRTGDGVLPTDLSAGENIEANTRTVTVSIGPEETRALLQDLPTTHRAQIRDALLAALGRSLAAWTGRDRIRVDLEGHGREDLFPDVDLSRTVGWFTTIYPFTLALGPDVGMEAALKAVKEQLRAVPDRGLSYGALRYVDPEAAAALAALPPAGLLFNYLGQFDQGVAESSIFRSAPEPCGPWHAPRGRRTHLIEVIASVTRGRLEVRFLYSETRHRAATIERLAGAFGDGLLEIVGAGRRTGARAFTPSDFPLVRLDQDAVDRLARDYPLEDVLPLSPLQRLFYSMEATQVNFGFEPWRFRLQGPLDPETLRAAWDDVLTRHEVLRTAYTSDGLTDPVQAVVGGVRPEWAEEDWRRLAHDEQVRRRQQLVRSDRARGFDLARPPLTRLTLVRLEDEAWELHWSTHHLHVDGWSWPLIFRDLSALYEARRSGRPAGLPPACPYRRYLSWLQESAPDSEAFWREALAGFSGPTPLLPAEGPFPAAPDEPFGEESVRVSLETSEALRALARAGKLTLNTLVQGAWAIALGHWSGEDEVTLGAAFSGRPAELPGIESMVGPCVSNLPLRLRLERAAPVASWLAELQRKQFEASAHQYAPLERIQEWAGVPWRLRLFQSLIVFQNYVVEKGARRLGSDVSVAILSAPEATNYPITLVVVPDSKLHLRLLFHRDRTSPATARAMAQDVSILLRALPEAKDAPLDSLLDLPSAATRRWAAPPPRRREAAPQAPCSEMERRIAAIWADLFQLEAISLDDNFFDLGGHSLLLLRAHARLREEIDTRLPVVALLQHPTVRALARHLDGRLPDAGAEVIARAHRAREALSRRRRSMESL